MGADMGLGGWSVPETRPDWSAALTQSQGPGTAPLSHILCQKLATCIWTNGNNKDNEGA